MGQFAKLKPVSNRSKGPIPLSSAKIMSDTTNYQFKLRILTVEVIDVTISATATTSKVIAAGTFFAVGLLFVLGAYADKISTLLNYVLK